MLGQERVALLQRHLHIKLVCQLDDGPCALRSQLCIRGNGIQVAQEVLCLLQAAVGQGSCNWAGALAVAGKLGLQDPKEDAGVGCQVR